MTGDAVEVDYLVIGAGATGMAFTDTLVHESAATVAIVDKHDKPGGHWNDAYAFVRLQQPSLFYGASSHRLGTGSLDRAGLNQGMFQLASGSEVLYHYDTVMNETLLSSGKVEYFPLSVAKSDGIVTSLVSGKTRQVRAKKVVDARYYEAKVPSVVRPAFRMEDGARVVPPNALSSTRDSTELFASFVVIGGGKTGIDTCLWLLQHDIDPDRIAWVIPRDFWIQDRANFQPGEHHLLRFVTSAANQLDALVRATSSRNLFERLEEVGELRRIDRDVEPTAYHCSVISDGEFALLSRIRNIIRKGHVREVRPDGLTFDKGRHACDGPTLYINCTAQGIYRRPARKIFDGREIVLQWLRTCQPSFSASLIGFLEATITDEDVKNHLCEPNIAPDIPTDWIRMMRINLVNHQRWARNPAVEKWLSNERNSFFASDPAVYGDTKPDVVAQLERFQTLQEPALAAIDRLLATSTTDVAPALSA